MLNRKVPVVTFKTRVRDESLGGDNPYKWENKTSSDYFSGKKEFRYKKFKKSQYSLDTN